MKRITMLLSIVLVFALVSPAALVDSLKPGKVQLQAAGSLAFGPEGILFVGDHLGASIYALETKDTKAGTAGTVNLAGIDGKIAAMLGTTADQIQINDIVSNPVSKNIYISVSRGKGPDAKPVILVSDPAGNLKEFALENVRHSSVSMPNAPAADARGRGGLPVRMEAITDLEYVNGKVIVAGLSNEEFASNLRSIPFPFQSADRGASVEIFHGNHGRLETNSPVRTFTTMSIKAEPHLLAAYTCTPLVKIPLTDLQPGKKVNGVTIAELGSGNRPLDMIVYKKGGTNWILMNNSSRGVMKMSADGLDKFSAITARVPGLEGVPYETIASLKGVAHLDLYSDSSAVILIKTDAGAFDLKTIALP